MTRKKTAPVKSFHYLATTVDPSGVRAYGKDGKEIDPQQLPELLQVSRHVLLSRDGLPVHPSHLREVSAEALILVIPALKGEFSPAPRDEKTPDKPGG